MICRLFVQRHQCDRVPSSGADKRGRCCEMDSLEARPVQQRLQRPERLAPVSRSRGGRGEKARAEQKGSLRSRASVGMLPRFIAMVLLVCTRAAEVCGARRDVRATFLLRPRLQMGAGSCGGSTRSSATSPGGLSLPIPFWRQRALQWGREGVGGVCWASPSPWASPHG